jgi:hypothetical protein
MGRMVTWAGLSQPLDHLGGPDQSPQDNAEPATRGVGRGFFFVRTRVQTLFGTPVASQPEVLPPCHLAVLDVTELQ